jgi:hypothetical protein
MSAATLAHHKMVFDLSLWMRVVADTEITAASQLRQQQQQQQQFCGFKCTARVFLHIM